MGSSPSRIGGSQAIARAIATRCCSPPDSSSGSRSPRSPSPTVARWRPAMALRSRDGPSRARSSGSVAFSARGERRHQLEELEDDADGAAAPDGELVLGHLVQAAAVDRHRPGRGPVDARDEVEDRRLAAARRAGDRHHLARGDGQVHAAQRAEADPTRRPFPPSLAVGLLHVGQLDDGRRGRGPGHRSCPLPSRHSGPVTVPARCRAGTRARSPFLPAAEHRARPTGPPRPPARRRSGTPPGRPRPRAGRCAWRA